MTSRERFMLTFEHKEPDRIPFDIGGTPDSSININTLQAGDYQAGLRIFLISQYMPVQYDRIRHGEIENNATALIKDKINCVMDRYYSACKSDQE